MNTTTAPLTPLAATLVVLALGCGDNQISYSNIDEADAGQADAVEDVETPPDTLEEPDVPDDACIPEAPPGTCRLDWTCGMFTSSQPWCLDGVCSSERECEPNELCECIEDGAECPDGELCEGGACNPADCEDDCECGLFVQCAPEGVCRPCTPTCDTDTDCAPGDRCESYGYAGSCTRCVPDCPLPVSGEATSTTAFTLDPDSFVDEEVILEGRLMSEVNICDDLGPCGTCTSGLALDGLLRLRGLDGAIELCGALMGCEETEDTCLPLWDCAPFPIGQRVAVRGKIRSVGPSANAQPFYRFLEPYRLEVEAIEVRSAPNLLDGRFAGTLSIEEVTGADCDGFLDSLPEGPQPIEFVLAFNETEGIVVELMSPETTTLPVSGGWHLGQMAPGSGCIDAAFGLGQFSACPSGLGYQGRYTFSLSGPDCTLTSLIEAEQVY